MLNEIGLNESGFNKSGLNENKLDKNKRNKNRASNLTTALALAIMVAVLAGCVSAPPKRSDDACRMLSERSKWLKHTRRAVKRWRADGALMLAIMRQESSFRANARPARKRFLGIPLKRPSSAFGYAQAIDGTWKLYQRSAKRGRAKRNNFADAIDFIGWYTAQTRKRLKIPARDAYGHYLAYHEGWKGYARGTYKRKKWLRNVAKRVARQADRYRAQLARCGIKV